MEFYEGFENRDQLIQWMKERPKGVSYIHEVEGDKDIIVVIPTADFKGKYARECRDSIFKGLHMVFVESGGKGDFYFNYAHNCNVGIKRAMEYNPKWVVVSNDDMYKIDDVFKLRSDLNSIKPETDLIWTGESCYHAYTISIRMNNILGNWFKVLSPSILAVRPRSYYANIFFLKDKFLNRFFAHTKKTGFIHLSSDKVEDFKITSNFTILSHGLFEKIENIVFDENYINGYEDIDFSIRMHYAKILDSQINYLIGDIIGGTLGVTLSRTYRDIVNVTYFNWKIENNYLNIKLKLRT
jgi:hypothetical protein